MFFCSSCWPHLLAPSYCNVKITALSFYYFAWRDWRTPDKRSKTVPNKESLQILRIHSSVLVLLLFSSPHSFSTGFRSENWNGHGRSFILCSVTHFCFDFDVCFGLLSWWKIQPQRFLTEAVGLDFFYLLVFDRIHDAMHLNKTTRISGRKTGPQH